MSVGVNVVAVVSYRGLAVYRSRWSVADPGADDRPVNKGRPVYSGRHVPDELSLQAEERGALLRRPQKTLTRLIIVETKGDPKSGSKWKWTPR